MVSLGSNNLTEVITTDAYHYNLSHVAVLW